MKVNNAMHKPVKCVELDTPIREVASRMRRVDVGAIPVQRGALVV
jgi:CBS domain-containing protein